MNSVSARALASMLVLGSIGSVALPAFAQVPAPTAARDYRVTKQERAALAPLQAAVNARNWPAATAALPAAQAAAKSDDARYMLTQLQYRIAVETQNVSMQAQLIDAMAPTADAADLPALLQNQGALAAAAGERRKAETIFTRLLELQPTNSLAMMELARIKNDLRKPADAAALTERAIAVRKASGQQAPESWYRFAARIAVDTKQAEPSGRLNRDLVTAYPSPATWRDAILAYVDLRRPAEGSLDAWRLMRATKALAGERDYLLLAQAASSAGLHAEAKAVLDEGVTRRMVDPSKAVFKELLASSAKRATTDKAGLAAKEKAATAAATGTLAMAAADQYFAQGDYAKAATLYAAAAQKGGVDMATNNTRLGQALAMAGRRAEAETAFAAVTGPSAELAALWATWLRQSA